MAGVSRQASERTQPCRGSQTSVSGQVHAIAVQSSPQGRWAPSRSGRTYLLVLPVPGDCGDLYLDGEPWTVGFGVPGRVEPGVHAIDCDQPDYWEPGGDIEFEVAAGTTYVFDYWGP